MLQATWQRGRNSSRGKVKNFFSPCIPDRCWGPPSLLSIGYQGSFPPGVKEPGRKAAHLQLVLRRRIDYVHLYNHSLPHMSSSRSVSQVKQKGQLYVFLPFYRGCYSSYITVIISILVIIVNLTNFRQLAYYGYRNIQSSHLVTKLIFSVDMSYS